MFPKIKIDELKSEGTLLLNELNLENFSFLKVKRYLMKVTKILDGEF